MRWLAIWEHADERRLKCSRQKNWEWSLYHVLGSVARLLMRDRQIAHASAATCVASGVAASSARRSLTVRERARAGDANIVKYLPAAASKRVVKGNRLGMMRCPRVK